MGAIIWTLESCVNTILDIVVIKTGIVISEDYLIKILNQEFPNSYFEHYVETKNNGIRVRSEDFDEYCWKIRQRLGELENISPLFIQNVEKCLLWEAEGIDYVSIVRKILKMCSDQFNPDFPKLVDPEVILAKLISEKEYPVEVIYQAFSDIVHNQKLFNIIKPVEEILWDGGISLKDLFLKEHIPVKAEDFIDQKFINY